MKISAFKHYKQLKYPNGRLMPLNAPVPKINFNSQGVSKFFRVPYLFQCSFFLFIIIWQGQETLSIFSALQYVLTANKETRNKRWFFSRKSQLKIISPLDLHFSIVSGFETQQDWSQFSSKCKFEQHYTFCHHTIYVGLRHPVKNHRFPYFNNHPL